MRSSERFIKRLVIPVIVTGVIAVAIYYVAVIWVGSSSEHPAQENNVPPPPAEPAAVQQTEKPDNAEVQSLQKSISKLDERASKLGETKLVDPPADNAHQKVDALAQADSSDQQRWEAMKDEAFDAVQQYATAVGAAERSVTEPSESGK